MAIKAVLTGDIVNSTKLPSAKEIMLTRRLEDLFTGKKFEFYRGDSFQAYLKKPEEALRLALLCRTAAISISKEEKLVLSDVRISIGIGEVNIPVRTLKTAKGEAFVLSGHGLDEISNNQERLVMAASNALANQGLQVISDYINAIFSTMTGKQAEVIFLLLQGNMQQQVAQQLNKTKSTIHQRVTSGRWPEIEKLLQYYENIINQLS